MNSPLKAIFWVWLWGFLFLGTQESSAADLTASLLTRAGGQTIPGKIFLKGEKTRVEVEVIGQKGITILRPDRKLMYIILPPQKAYLEAPLTSEAGRNALCLAEEDQAGLKIIGTETLEGYICDKYEGTYQEQGKSGKFFLWMARELKRPIKMVTEDGSVSVELRQIRQEPLAEALFEPPPGFRLLKFPAAPKPR